MNIHSIEWEVYYTSLHEKGYAIIPCVLSKQECRQLTSHYDENHLYRATINMQRYLLEKANINISTILYPC